MKFSANLLVTALSFSLFSILNLSIKISIVSQKYKWLQQKYVILFVIFWLNNIVSSSVVNGLIKVFSRAEIYPFPE